MTAAARDLAQAQALNAELRRANLLSDQAIQYAEAAQHARLELQLAGATDARPELVILAHKADSIAFSALLRVHSAIRSAIRLGGAS
jgi:hypothetical protein